MVDALIIAYDPYDRLTRIEEREFSFAAAVILDAFSQTVPLSNERPILVLERVEGDDPAIVKLDDGKQTPVDLLFHSPVLLGLQVRKEADLGLARLSWCEMRHDRDYSLARSSRSLLVRQL